MPPRQLCLSGAPGTLGQFAATSRYGSLGPVCGKEGEESSSRCCLCLAFPPPPLAACLPHCGECSKDRAYFALIVLWLSLLPTSPVPPTPKCWILLCGGAICVCFFKPVFINCYSMWGLSSPARDGTHITLTGRWLLNSGPLGKSPQFFLYYLLSIYLSSCFIICHLILSLSLIYNKRVLEPSSSINPHRPILWLWKSFSKNFIQHSYFLFLYYSLVRADFLWKNNQSAIWKFFTIFLSKKYLEVYRSSSIIGLNVQVFKKLFPSVNKEVLTSSCRIHPKREI